MRVFYYLKDGGGIMEQIQVSYSEANQEEKDRWADYRQDHAKRIRELTPKEIIELLNKAQHQ